MKPLPTPTCVFDSPNMLQKTKSPFTLLPATHIDTYRRTAAKAPLTHISPAAPPRPPKEKQRDLVPEFDGSQQGHAGLCDRTCSHSDAGCLRDRSSFKRQRRRHTNLEKLPGRLQQSRRLRI